MPAELASQFDPAANVTLQVNPIVFDGPLPASRTIWFALPTGLPAGNHAVTLRATLRTGAAYTTTCSQFGSFTMPSSGVTAPAAAIGPVAGSPDNELAFTGRPVLLTTLVALAMLGAGAGLGRESRRHRSTRIDKR